MANRTLLDLLHDLKRFRDERNWAQFHTPKDLAISVSLEAAELLELFQWRSQSADNGPDLKEAARTEVADILIYLLLFCDQLEIDLLLEAEKKLRLNEKRFPVETSRNIAKPVDQMSQG